jgi:Sec-independent protein translocase protein TatA
MPGLTGPIRKVPIRLPTLLKALASAVKYQKREMRQARQVHPKVRNHVRQLTFSLELYLPSQDNSIEIV